jgi:hypothetical protein|tara:strand:+ start:2406 stop:2564 length:159 start_codon:yes stop_codon:yes gene_type:complete
LNRRASQQRFAHAGEESTLPCGVNDEVVVLKSQKYSLGASHRRCTGRFFEEL